MNLYKELSAQEKLILGFSAKERIFVELIPPENTPIVVLRQEKPLSSLV